MKRDITERILQYLQLDTNYAIILNGNYGIGKTYYVKNELFKYVKRLKIPHNESKNYQGVLISLFGIKSINELQNRILLELNPKLKQKGISVISGITRGTIKMFGIDPQDIMNIVADASIDYSEFLLCIDDFDRKDENLTIKEIFGFINNLIENFSAKILIIAKEEYFNENNGNSFNNDYLVTKEKVVGVSFTFNNDIDKVYDIIIKEKYETKNKPFFDYLSNYKVVITNVIKQNNNNLRNLFFFLEQFKIIFDTINNNITESKNNKFLSLKTEILKNVLQFSLPISIEFKMGNLLPDKYSEIIDLYREPFLIQRTEVYTFLSDETEVDEKNEKQDYIEQFKEKYFDYDEKYFYFESIFNYFVGINSFKFKKFVSELNSLYRFDKKTIPEKEIILNKLSYWKFVNLDFSEYRSFTKKMLNFAYNGEYRLDQYNLVFHFATRFNNPLKFNPEKLADKLISGILKGKNNFNYSLDFDPHLDIIIENYKENRNDHIRIKKYCLHTNEKIHLEQFNNETSMLFELYKKDFDSFLAKLKNNINYYHTPIFDRFNFNIFWRHFVNCKNSQIIDFANYLQNRYKSSRIKKLKSERVFLDSVKKRTSIKINSKATLKMIKITFEYLDNILEGLISKFN